MTKTVNLRHGPKFVIGALLGLGVFYPAVSEAVWWQRYSTAGCVNVNGGGKWQDVPSPGRHYRAQSPSETVLCPVMSSNTAPHNQATAIWVQVVDNSPVRAIYAKACVKFHSSAGGACGALAQSTTPGTGQWPLLVPGTAWSANPDHYPYIEVEMNATPCSGSGGTGGAGCVPTDVGAINGYYVESL